MKETAPIQKRESPEDTIRLGFGAVGVVIIIYYCHS